MKTKKTKKSKAIKDVDWDPSDDCHVPIPKLIERIKEEGVYVYDLETTGLS